MIYMIYDLCIEMKSLQHFRSYAKLIMDEPDVCFMSIFYHMYHVHNEKQNVFERKLQYETYQVLVKFTQMSFDVRNTFPGIHHTFTSGWIGITVILLL